MLRVTIEDQDIKFFRLYDYLNDTADTFSEVRMNETDMAHDRTKCRPEFSGKRSCVASYDNGTCADGYLIKWGDLSYTNREGVNFWKFQCLDPNDLGRVEPKKYVLAEHDNFEDDIFTEAFFGTKHNTI